MIMQKPPGKSSTQSTDLIVTGDKRMHKRIGKAMQKFAEHDCMNFSKAGDAQRLFSVKP